MPERLRQILVGGSRTFHERPPGMPKVVEAAGWETSGAPERLQPKPDAVRVHRSTRSAQEQKIVLHPVSAFCQADSAQR